MALTVLVLIAAAILAFKSLLARIPRP